VGGGVGGGSKLWGGKGGGFKRGRSRKLTKAKPGKKRKRLDSGK